MWVFYVFIVVIIIQILFYALFLKFALAKKSSLPIQNLPVSVVICAKNEAHFLQKFLPLIAKQDYPNFEIVLVDDASSDQSLNIMYDFKKRFESSRLSIHILAISKQNSKGKKFALSEGISFAKNEYLILTDADCKPVSSLWLSELTKQFSDKKSIVLGYGAYKKIKGSFLNKLIRFETLLTAIQYFSYAQINNPYMGVGRNIAYKKITFNQASGFEKHSNILSGDDDLFINQIANTKNTAICFSSKSFTVSEPKTNFKHWIKQKRRHISTANHYKNKHKISLGIFYLSQFLFWSLSFILLFINILPHFILALIALRFLIWYMVLVNSSNKLNEKDLIRYAPFLEFSVIFIQLYIFVKNLNSSPKHW